MVSLTYRSQDLVKFNNESFDLEHIFKCDRNILVLSYQFTKRLWGKRKVSLAWDNNRLLQRTEKQNMRSEFSSR